MLTAKRANKCAVVIKCAVLPFLVPNAAGLFGADYAACVIAGTAVIHVIAVDSA